MEVSARILVIDDEDRFRQSMARLLAKNGHVVEAAPDGMTAIGLLENNDFDVVLLDMKMPGLSGEETFHQITQRGFDVETICLTGHVSTSDAMKLLQKGAFDYLLEPAALPEILECITRAVESKRQRNDEIQISHLIG